MHEMEMEFYFQSNEQFEKSLDQVTERTVSPNYSKSIKIITAIVVNPPERKLAKCTSVRRDDHTVVPSSHHILLKIVGFQLNKLDSLTPQDL